MKIVRKEFAINDEQERILKYAFNNDSNSWYWIYRIIMGNLILKYWVTIDSLYK